MTQMYRRCPNARAIRYEDTGRLATVELPDYRLEFMLHADVQPCAGNSVIGGLYSVTKYDLEQLDRYEGVAAGYYRRMKQTLADQDGVIHEFIFYAMCGHPSKNGAPTQAYYDICAEGYREWDIPLNQLEEARVRALAHTPKTNLRTGDLVVDPFYDEDPDDDRNVADLVGTARTNPRDERIRREMTEMYGDLADSNSRYHELLAREQENRRGGN